MKKIYLGPKPDPKPWIILTSAEGIEQVEEAFRAELEKEIGEVVILSKEEALMHDKPTVMVSDNPPAFAEIPSMEYKARYELPEIKKSGREARRERRLKQRKNKKR